QAQRGDPEAFGELVRQFQNMAVGYAYSILQDFDLAEDAAQEAFLQAYVSLPGLKDVEAFPAWFRRIVFSQCTRHLRGRRFVTAPLENIAALPEPGASPHQLAEERETAPPSALPYARSPKLSARRSCSSTLAATPRQRSARCWSCPSRPSRAGSTRPA